jgi:hypothetical protein
MSNSTMLISWQARAGEMQQWQQQARSSTTQKTACAVQVDIIGCGRLVIITDGVIERSVELWSVWTVASGLAWFVTFVQDQKYHRHNKQGCFSSPNRNVTITPFTVTILPSSGIARELEARTHQLAYHKLNRASGTTPKHLVQSECESDRAVYCTQYIARSLSARSAVPDSGVGGDRSLGLTLLGFRLAVTI